MRYAKPFLNLALTVGCTLAASVALAQAGPPPATTGTGPSAYTPQSGSTPTATTAYEDPVTYPVDEPSTLRWPNRPLLITGSAVVTAFYLPAVVFQASQDRNNDLYIPVAGPWMDLASGNDGRLAKALLGADGVMQGLGALSLLASFAIPEKRTRNWYLLGNGRAFNVSPVRTAGQGYALMAHGQF